MSSGDDDVRVCGLITILVPIVKKRIVQAADRSREDVEFELATLANLLTIQERMKC